MKTVKKRIRHILVSTFSLFMLISPAMSFASSLEVQQGSVTVRGKVVDKTGESLIGVSVAVKGTGTGTITDINGDYSINVSGDGAVLSFSYIGYLTQEIRVGNQTSINVTLLEDDNVLDEVVVVGYGVQKKVNLTGSVSTVSSEKLANRPAMNLSSSLAGLAPGVQITQASGNPGAEDVSISIRGTGSINANTPMILVDGVVADMTVVNPDDVESISFLKDAASAAIYGSRAANGVVLVTTKKGKREAPRVTFSAMFASEKPRTSMKYMSSTADFMELHNTAVTNSNPGSTLRYSEETIAEWRAADANPNGIYTHPVTGNQISNWLAYPNTDWAQELYKESFYHRYNVSISGGSETSTYLLSASYQNNPGSLENTGMERYNVRANVETKVKDFLTVGTQTWATKEFKDPGSTSLTYLTQAYPGTNPKYQGLYGAAEDANMPSMNNPLYSVASTGGQREYTRINTTWFANSDIWKGISFEAKINYNEYQRQDRTYSLDLARYRFREGTDEPVEGQSTVDQATTTRYSYFSRSYTADLILRYMGSFGDHDISAFAAYEQYYYQTSGFRLTAQGLLDWNVTDINSASEMLNWGTDTNKNNDSLKQLGILSYFGRVNYGYKGKYLFEFNIRADGSSRFAPGHRWGVFPSFSGGWRISEENFFQPAKKYIDNLKIKASYGKLGNQVSGYYDWQDIYKKVNNVFNESVQNGVVQSQIPNYNLSWEKTSTVNLGFEANLLSQRLSVDFDYFTSKTTDMLETPPTYLTIGTVSMPKFNEAAMKTKGIDLTMGWNDRINDFRYSATVNVGYSKNEVTKYKGTLVYEQDPTVLDIWGNPTWRYTNLGDVGKANENRYLVEGHMAHEYYLQTPYKGTGTYFNGDGTVNPNGGPKDGMIRTKADLDWVRAMMDAGYKFNNKSVGPGAANLWYGDVIMDDLNGDGNYGGSDDYKFTGKSRTPKWTVGLNLYAEWKGIDVSMSWAGRFGAYNLISERGTVGSTLSTNTDVLPADAYSKYYFYDAVKAAEDENYDPATDPNANITARYPRLLTSANTSTASTLYLFNTSYMKLKSLQIGYTFPRKWIQSAKLSNLRVYVAGENLLTIKSSKFPGVDPEFGHTVLAYPMSRTLSGGVVVSF